jgi:hypothetical protein
MDNVAVGAQLRYLRTSGRIETAGESTTARIDALLFSGSLRVYLAGFRIPRF